MSKTALLLMDLQNAIVSHFPSDPGFTERVQKVTDAARKSGFPIIYVTVKFRPNYPEVSPQNKSFNALKAGGFSLAEGKRAN